LYLILGASGSKVTCCQGQYARLCCSGLTDMQHENRDKPMVRQGRPTASATIVIHHEVTTLLRVVAKPWTRLLSSNFNHPALLSPSLSEIGPAAPLHRLINSALTSICRTTCALIG
jgi:hypothetical protein